VVDVVVEEAVVVATKQTPHAANAFDIVNTRRHPQVRLT